MFIKKFIQIILISAAFVSCTKEGISTVTPAPGSASGTTSPRTFTCTINGASFTADSAWYNNFNAGKTNIFATKGSGSTLQFFEINLNAQTATTYAIPANSFTYLNATNTYAATTGSLSISTYDMTNRKISGSFTGVTTGAITITNGSFTNLPYK